MSAYGSAPKALRPQPKPSSRPFIKDIGIVATGAVLAVHVLVLMKSTQLRSTILWSVVLSSLLTVVGRVSGGATPT